MRKPLRPLVLAAVLQVLVGAGAVSAQTVVVRQVPPGSTVELVLNATPIGSTTADTAGDAILPLNLSEHIGRAETDASVTVDVCGEVRRVFVVERALRPPPPQVGCDRREIIGMFVVRRISTLVVNVGVPNPTMLLVQGPFDLRERGPARVWQSPTGLVLFGAAGLRTFRDFSTAACGNVSECSGGGSGGTLTVGAAFWINRFVAAEAAFTRPAEAEVQGSGENFRFDTSYNAQVATIAGNIGVPIGPVRLYGKVGTTYQQSRFTTTQTQDDVTVAGGVQTFELRTAGWGWLFGGGMEVWMNQRFGLYGEVSRAGLRGPARDDAEGETSEGLTSLLFGARIRIGR